ncbi:ATP-dependent Clp protease proteolytic subunit [bacterium]|nr:ATP-dependent Clp protease proteolytic subunit [bacterium]
MNIWYTITGGIDPNVAQGLIAWVNGQVYDGQVTKLTLFLSSVGGDIDSAIRIYSFLKGLPIEVEIIGFSQIDSAANTIFLASKNRKALKGCRFFLHEGTFTIGNQTATLHAHEETLTVLRELLNRNVKIISTETQKTESEIAQILKEGKIFNAKEAFDFGIVTEILERLPDSPIKKNCS